MRRSQALGDCHFMSYFSARKRFKSPAFWTLGLVVSLTILYTGLIDGLLEPAFAQTTVQSTPVETAQPTPAVEQAPAINRLLPAFPIQWPQPILGEAATEVIAPVYLDGRAIFYLSATTAAGQEAAELRAQEIQKRLNALAIETLDQAQSDGQPPGNSSSGGRIAVTVATDPPSGLPVIEVGGEPFLTVTTLDAQLIGLASPEDYARTLAENLETAFARYRQERQSEFLQRQIALCIGIGIVALVLQIVIRRLIGRIKQRLKYLSTTETQLGKATSIGRPPLVNTPTADVFESVFELLKARLDNRQKRKINETVRGLLVISQYVLWVLVSLWTLARFPYTRWLTTLLLYWLELPGQIFLAAGIAYVLLRVSSFLIDKVGFALQEGAQWAPESSQRLKLRFLTFSQVAKGLVGAVIFGTLLLIVLAIAGIRVGPILAGAGIVGVGISLAAQSLIKDIINGFLILFEDQFGIGDIVSIQGLTGTVERLNLRITQLRDIEGRLITIPNSQISIVENLSKDWSQVDLVVQVAPTVDLSKVLPLLKETAIAIANEPQWQQFILEPPDLLGVESVDHTGIAIRLLLKTQPSKQFLVARELRARVKHAFDKAGISLGVPQRKLEVFLEKHESAAIENEEWTFGSVQSIGDD